MVKRTKAKKSATKAPDTPSELIWSRLAKEPGGPRKADYAGIVKAATAIADREGLEAVSMRNVAAKLKLGTMSLYRYVTSKDELLDLILDHAYGEIGFPSTGGPSTGSLRVMARETRAMLNRHFWLGPLLTRRPTLGPNYLKWFEALLHAASTLTANPRIQLRIIGTIHSYVSGFAGYELGELETNRKYQLTEERKHQMAAPYLANLFADGGHPYLQQIVGLESLEPTDEDFEWGLSVILDGIEANCAQVTGRMQAH